LKPGVFLLAFAPSLSGSAASASPTAATDIAPVHSLASKAMQRVGTPSVLSPSAASRFSTACHDAVADR